MNWPLSPKDSMCHSPQNILKLPKTLEKIESIYENQGKKYKKKGQAKTKKSSMEMGIHDVRRGGIFA